MLGRESYTTLAGEGAVAIPAPEAVSVARDRSGTGFAQDPVAVRAGASAGGVVVAVCDWDAGFWLPIFPPLPIPILSMEGQTGLPDTTAVRITFESKGAWRAAFSDIALLGPNGSRVPPFRYRIVLAKKSESLGDNGAESGKLEPCTRGEEPATPADQAKFAVLERGELWLLFDTKGLPKGKRELSLDGFSRDDVKVPMPHLSLSGGSRWYWYKAFP